MKSTPVLFSALAIIGTVAADKVRGLDPALAAKYAPKDNKFTCLDGSKTIPFTAVNDNYCDCPDGSDEPGTSACEGLPASGFYCENKGHVPSRILASRVNDHICDPECCDGSDEAPGVCPNRCEEIARVSREKAEAEAKVRRTGAKIRSTYVNFAQKERKRLEDDFIAKKAELAERQKKVEEAKSQLDRAEAQSRDEIEKKKQTPLFQSLDRHRDAVVRLRTEIDKTKEDLTTVLRILEDLDRDWNPNGQDMSLKAAVMGYRELVGKVETPPAAEKPEGEAAEGEATEVTKEPETKESEIKLYTLQKPEGEIPRWEVDQLTRQDLEALLADDGDDDNDNEGLLYRLEEYIPDSLFDYYDTARDWLASTLQGFGVLKVKQMKHDGPHVAAAREKFQTAERELRDTNSAITSDESTLRRLGDEQFYGPQGEWKKLDGTCIETISGDYTYELCFFGQARQKSNKDSSSNHLGTFSDWTGGGETGSFDYYTKQSYSGGARCWNGPLRSVNVEYSCGTTNAITSVSEPEKCEYKFKATTPALCWPLEGSDNKKDEL